MWFSLVRVRYDGRIGGDLHLSSCMAMAVVAVEPATDVTTSSRDRICAPSQVTGGDHFHVSSHNPGHHDEGADKDDVIAQLMKRDSVT